MTEETKNAERAKDSGCSESPCYVPYADLPFEKDKSLELGGGVGWVPGDGRQISVYPITNAEGVMVYIENTLEDGKKSLLKFRLSNEAAIALADCFLAVDLTTHNS